MNKYLLPRTPFKFAFNGNICPGRLKSDALQFGSDRALRVAALSLAEIPVVVPSDKT